MSVNKWTSTSTTDPLHCMGHHQLPTPTRSSVNADKPARHV